MALPSDWLRVRPSLVTRDDLQIVEKALLNGRLFSFWEREVI
jgi:hypothetical protein